MQQIPPGRDGEAKLDGAAGDGGARLFFIGAGDGIALEAVGTGVAGDGADDEEAAICFLHLKGGCHHSGDDEAGRAGFRRGR